MPQPKSHDFSQTREQWERAVVADATVFTVAMVLGRYYAPDPVFDDCAEFHQHETPAGWRGRAKWEFSTLAQAVNKVAVLRHVMGIGRQPLVYAVTPAGRSVHLSSQECERLLHGDHPHETT